MLKTLGKATSLYKLGDVAACRMCVVCSAEWDGVTIAIKNLKGDSRALVHWGLCQHRYCQHQSDTNQSQLRQPQ